MEDNEKTDSVPVSVTDTPASDEEEISEQEVENTCEEVPASPPDKPKKFFERHPKAKNILQGAGVAAIFGGFLLIIKSLSHGDAPASIPTHLDKDTRLEKSAYEPYNESEQVSGVASTSDQHQDEAEYETATCNVTGHLMKLAKGKHASEAKIQEAHENGFKDVPDDMTYRSEHPKEYQRRK